MEEIIKFVQSFVAQEYEVMIQIRTESDTSMVKTSLNSLNQFFQGLDSDLYLSTSRKLAERDTVLGLLQPRVLFKIEQYAHSTFDLIYRVFLSSTFRGDHRYFSSFFIAHTERGLKIIARYNFCNDCKGVGKQKEFLCEECHGLGWNWRGGQKLESLGELVAARQFTPSLDEK